MCAEIYSGKEEEKGKFHEMVVITYPKILSICVPGPRPSRRRRRRNGF